MLSSPCNQCRKQELDNTEEIALICFINYRVSFPMFEKVGINGLS
nr:hypothetical protein [Providencia sp. PROV153]